jgi:phosphohistidine phosphatase
MLVGHNPTILQTLETLIGHDALTRALPSGFPTAGLGVLDPTKDAAQGWVLTDFISD